MKESFEGMNKYRSFKKLMNIYLDHVVLINVGNEPHPLAPTIPSNVFMIFQWFEYLKLENLNQQKIKALLITK